MARSRKKSVKQNPPPLSNAESTKDGADQKVADEQSENKAPIQIIFEITLFGGGGLLAFGAILDAFSNALSIVTPRVTIVGTVVAVIVSIIVLLVKSKPNTGKKYRNFINLFRWSNKEWFALTGIVFLLWTPYWLRSLTGSPKEENSQSEKAVSSNMIDDKRNTILPEAVKSKVTFSYMRLFGAFQVPKLFDESAQHVMPFDFKVSGDWWNERFPNTILLREPLWGQVKEARLNFDDKRQEGISETRLWKLVFRNNIAESEKYLERQGTLIVETMSGLAPPKKQKKLDEESRRVIDFFEKNTGKIGFLFLVIDWDSEKYDFDEIRLHFKEVSNNFGDVLQKDVADANLINAEIKSVVLPIPQVKSKQYLWLLSVYEKDADGYPKEYVSSVLEPQYLTVRLGNTVEQIEIRKPYGKEAAKIDLPLGWYWQ